MKKIFNVQLLTFVFLLIFSSMKINAQHRYFDEYRSLAENLSNQYGIPSAIILGVAFLESGAGKSKNSKVLKNHFGIVGKNTINNSVYRNFPSVEDSYLAFCKLLSRKKYYEKLKGTTNHKEWITAIASAGYSTNPEEWKRKVNWVINKYNLNNNS